MQGWYCYTHGRGQDSANDNWIFASVSQRGGCPGNNDSGGTSSWHVWACLGLYPYTGTPYYLIGSPSVESAEVDFLRGKLKIKVLRESAGSIYPIGYSFNGRDFREPWMEICELEKGGELVFKLSDKPMPGNTPVPPWFD